MKPLDTPIFFVNRNRHRSLKQMIEWLWGRGYKNITVIDNNSSYAPLLDYYKKIDSSIRVIMLDENAGPWVLWKRGMHKELDRHYIVSDSDLVPMDCCPDDLIQLMHLTLERYEFVDKVAPGLDILNLSPRYSQSKLVYDWECQFWQRPVGVGLYAAGVDTTFAMYRANSEFSNDPERNIRLGYPYVLEHGPWLVDDDNLDEEEIFYRSHVEGNFSYWSSSAPDNRLLSAQHNINASRSKRIINLGCNIDYIPGWLNVGDSSMPVDLNYDFGRCGEERLPFESNSIDGIYMGRGFPVVNNASALWEDLHRVSRAGAKLFIRIPRDVASHSGLFNHESSTPSIGATIKYLENGLGVRGCDGDNGRWALDQFTIVVDDTILYHGADQIYAMIHQGSGSWREITIELSASKSGSANLATTTSRGRVVVTGKSLVYPSFSAPV